MVAGHLVEATAEVAALDLVGGQLQGLPVGGRREGGAAGPPLQVGPGGWEQVVAGQGAGRLQPVQQRQAGVRACRPSRRPRPG